MLEPEMRGRAIADFDNFLGKAGLLPGGYDYMLLITAVNDEIYGPVVASNLEHLRLNESAEVANEAAVALSSLVRRSSAQYWANSPGTRNKVEDVSDLTPEFQAEISALQTHAAHGDAPYLLAEQYAMTLAEGREQVIAADEVLGRTSPNAVQALSDANYSLYFSSNVMATAADIPDATLEEVVEAEGVEKMPHLTRTNLAIGQIVGQIAQSTRGNLTVVDIGSGTGATLASIFGALNGSHAFEKTNIVAVEPNRDFTRSLHSFAVKAGMQAREANPTYGISYSSQSDLVIAQPELQVVRKPISDVNLSGEVFPQGNDDVAVITANYSLHRLTSQATASLAETLGESAPNVICLFADLMANGSVINRRHFNFGNNGPLNCGNLELQKALEAAGFVVRKVGESETPKAIHPELATKIADEAANDGHMWIAYKGTEAERLIRAA